jgi:arabinogalactan endo-1,4-beta-galactosidase
VEDYVPETSDNTADSLIRGGDISTLSALEAAGKSFSDATGARPAEQILAGHGWNWVRLRLWVDPPNEFNGLADVTTMARRARQAHLRFLLCLHYSDFWADPAKQHIPAAWQGQDLRTLAETVHDYTRMAIATLIAQGAAPDIVQIGNEVTAGMLWPHGRIDRDGQEHWTEFATLLKAGIAGAREAGPLGHGPATMIHIDRGGDAPSASMTRFWPWASTSTGSGCRTTRSGTAPWTICARPSTRLPHATASRLPSSRRLTPGRWTITTATRTSSGRLPTCRPAIPRPRRARSALSATCWR